MSARHDYGPVTSYAYAIEHGFFEGTEAEWVEMLSQIGPNAQTAAQAATAAEGSATAAAGSASAAARSATSAGAAQTAAETAQGAAETAQGKAEDAQEAAEAAQSAAETAQGAAETAQGKAEDAQEAAEDAQAAAEAVLESIPQDYSELSQDVSDLKSHTLLNYEEIPDTTQSITFDSAGNVSTITHTRNNAAVRTDVFTFGANSITEVRTLNTGESLTIVTNTTTLETTVTYAAA